MRERPSSSAGSPTVVGRFAPSPTGYLHAGNIFSYLVAWIIARRANGRIVLRIEDLDPDRSKDQFAERIVNDLGKLGLNWDDGPIYQSKRRTFHHEAYEQLLRTGLIYPCFCTRADLHAASAPHPGEPHVYPGTCRRLTDAEIHAKRIELAGKGRSESFRLSVPDETVSFEDQLQGFVSYNLASECGDFVVRRSDGVFSYQLAVVVDDAASNVTSVVRGADLLASTPLQIFLQRQLGYPHPTYAHVPLLINRNGERIAKRHKAADLVSLLDQFGSCEAVIGHIAFATGLIDADEPVSAQDLLVSANLHAIEGKKEIVWHA